MKQKILNQEVLEGKIVKRVVFDPSGQPRTVVDRRLSSHGHVGRTTLQEMMPGDLIAEAIFTNDSSMPKVSSIQFFQVPTAPIRGNRELLIPAKTCPIRPTTNVFNLTMAYLNKPPSDDEAGYLPAGLGWDGTLAEAEIRRALYARQLFSFLAEKERDYVEERILLSPSGCMADLQKVHDYPLPSVISTNSVTTDSLDVEENPNATHVFYGVTVRNGTRSVEVGESTDSLKGLIEFIDHAYLDIDGKSFGACIRIRGQIDSPDILG